MRYCSTSSLVGLLLTACLQTTGRCQRKTTQTFFHCFASMSAYHEQRLREEKKADLEQRRNRLRAMLQDEQDRLEAELRELVPDRSTSASQLGRKTEELRTAREERRRKVAAVNQMHIFLSVQYTVYNPCCFCFVSLACTRAVERTLEEKQSKVARGSYDLTN